jgi:hypothetical protein
VELCEAIRRDIAAGKSIRAVAEKRGVHRLDVRQALKSVVPPPRKRLERPPPVRYAPATHDPTPSSANPHRSASQPSTAPDGAVRTSNITALRLTKTSKNSPNACLKVVDTFRQQHHGTPLDENVKEFTECMSQSR